MQVSRGIREGDADARRMVCQVVLLSAQPAGLHHPLHIPVWSLTKVFAQNVASDGGGEKIR